MAYDDERRETLFRDRDGDYKEWTQVTGFIFLIIVGVLFISGIIVGITAIGDKYEVQAFNRIHGTDYTWAEWFWAEGTIKEYHLGPVENKNIQVDLTVKGLPIELQGGTE